MGVSVHNAFLFFATVHHIAFWWQGFYRSVHSVCSPAFDVLHNIDRLLISDSRDMNKVSLVVLAFSISLLISNPLKIEPSKLLAESKIGVSNSTILSPHTPAVTLFSAENIDVRCVAARFNKAVKFIGFGTVYFSTICKEMSTDIFPF